MVYSYCSIVILVAGFFVSACQQKAPTQILQRHDDLNRPKPAEIQTLSLRGLDWDKVVVIDTRPLFEGSLDPLPRSFTFANKDWELPSRTEPSFEDYGHQLQRRLALKGISPDTPVLVVYKTPKEKAVASEAQRRLLQLGVKRSALITLKKFRDRTSSKRNWSLLKNVKPWRRPLNPR